MMGPAIAELIRRNPVPCLDDPVNDDDNAIFVAMGSLAAHVRARR